MRPSHPRTFTQPCRDPGKTPGSCSAAVRRPLGLWAASAPTAHLLHSLSLRLGLDWQLNGVSRPEVLALTNLGDSDPAALTARCRPNRVTLCLDDEAGRSFASRSPIPCFTYSESRPEADLTAYDLRTTSNGLTFLAVTKNELAQVTVPEKELYNALSALACGITLGVPLTASAEAVSDLLCRAASI